MDSDGHLTPVTWCIETSGQSPWVYLGVLSTAHFSSCCLYSAQHSGAVLTQEALDAGLIDKHIIKAPFQGH